MINIYPAAAALDVRNGLLQLGYQCGEIIHEDDYIPIFNVMAYNHKIGRGYLIRFAPDSIVVAWREDGDLGKHRLVEYADPGYIDNISNIIGVPCPPW